MSETRLLLVLNRDGGRRQLVLFRRRASPFTYRFTAAGGSGAVFDVKGAIPPGLTFDGVDTISGTYHPGSAAAIRGVQPQADRLPIAGPAGVEPDTITIWPPLSVIAIQMDVLAPTPFHRGGSHRDIALPPPRTFPRVSELKNTKMKRRGRPFKSKDISAMVELVRPQVPIDPMLA